MKADVRDLYSGSYGHAERLDGAIEVLVIERVHIMIEVFHKGNSCYFVTYKPDAVVARIRLNLTYCRAVPGHDRWLLSHGGT